MKLEVMLLEIEKIFNELRALMPMPAAQQSALDKKFRLEFNYNSNHIEGNTLTYGETIMFLIKGETENHHTFQEYEEMKGHDVAFELIKETAKDKERPLTEAFIKQLNEIILVRPFWKNAITPDGQPTRRLIEIGKYKQQPNSVRLQNGEMFHYTSPQETPIAMGDLVEWYKQEEASKKLHPIELAALLHYRFVCIHPFDDGNGRISRLLMNYVLLKNDYPPLIVKSADKKNYLFALSKADSGDKEAFVTYIASQLLWSLELSLKAAKGELIEEKDDWKKELEIYKKNTQNKNRVVKGTDEVIRQLYEQNIQPFFTQLIGELLEFNDLFDEKDHQIHSRFNNGSFFSGKLKDTAPYIYSWEDMKEHAQQGKRDVIEYREIELNFYWIGRKGVAKPYYISSSIKVVFKEYNYHIISTTNDKIKTTKLYSEHLTETEIEEIINEMAKGILAQIKRMDEQS